MAPSSPTPQENAPAPAVSQRGSPKKGTWRKAIPTGLGLVVLGSILAGFLPKPVPVETALVQTGPLKVAVLEEGKTRIRHRHVVSPPVPGYLQRIALRAGDRIEAGRTVLAVMEGEWSTFLNPRARAEAEARIQIAEAAQLRSDSEVDRVRASLELAQKERTRAQLLQKSGAISLKEWEAADNQVTVLTRALRVAEFSKQVAQFELAQAKATLQQAQAPNGGKTEPYRIIAPITGFVLSVSEENARWVAAGTPLMEVGDPRDLEAEIELLSSDAVAVRPGAPVSIEEWGGPAPLRASVSLVEPGAYTKVSALGVEEQRVKVRVEFVDELPAENPLGDRFRVEARIETWSAPDVLQLPTGALFRRGGDWLTFAVENGRARVRKVEIAHNNGVFAEVRSGLRAGQQVVLHPPDTLSEGQQVRPRDNSRP
jgi:HlyD family secretion protein